MTAGSHVQIRSIERDDLPRMYEIQLDSESNRMAVTNPRNRAAFDALWAEALEDPNLEAKAILLGGEFAGYISCFQVEGHDHVGYRIDRALWGQGIASRALQMLLHEVTRRPLEAIVATSNAASLRVLQKCGFVVDLVRYSEASELYPACEEAVLVLR